MKRITIIIVVIAVIVIVSLIYRGTNLNFIGKCSTNFTGTLVGPLQEADLLFELEDIKIGEKFTDSLKEKLGSPLKIEESLDDTSHIKTFYYSKYSITISLYAEEKISGISIFGEGVKTNRGLMVGDDEKTVIAKYGPCGSIQKYKDELVYMYSFKTKSGEKTYYRNIFITLSADTKKVKDISLIGG